MENNYDAVFYSEVIVSWMERMWIKKTFVLNWEEMINKIIIVIYIYINDWLYLYYWYYILIYIYIYICIIWFILFIWYCLPNHCAEGGVILFYKEK